MTVQRISHITLYVDDQNTALDWYVNKLEMEVVMDTSKVAPGMRWLTVGPPGNHDIQIVLLLARTEDERERIGKGSALVLRTDDCVAEIDRLQKAGVDILSAPTEVPFGVTATIRDLYGNSLDIVGPRNS